ncbi:hypothetical protein WT63_23020 [Burkholderia anthina]|nr:hypothetical protein WT63_23020 [Burkholderia anthina]
MLPRMIGMESSNTASRIGMNWLTIGIAISGTPMPVMPLAIPPSTSATAIPIRSNVGSTCRLEASTPSATLNCIIE